MIYSNKRKASPSTATTTTGTTTEVPRRRRYLACMYNYFVSVTTAFKDYSIYKNGYDPYQMKQYADESQFDPYHNNNYQVNKSEMDKMESDSDESDTTLCEENDNYLLPPAKRIRTMAVTAVDSAAHALLYGTFAAFNFVWSEKKNLGEYYFQEKSNEMSEEYQENSANKKRKVVMRGFGVDFSPLIERPAALQSRIDNSEKNLLEVCLRTKESLHDAVVTKTIHSYGGNQLVPSKRTFDDTWGFVDNDLSVNFKSTMPPQKPQRRVFKQPIQLRRAL